MAKDNIVSVVGDPNVIITHLGVKFDFINPRPESVHIMDIAYALSNIHRWGGQHRQRVSVAQHSLFVMRLLAEKGEPLETQLQGLMHDASEAYCGDICRPIKHKLPVFVEIEEKIMLAIAKALGFKWPMFEAVRVADDEALMYEWNAWQSETDPEVGVQLILTYGVTRAVKVTTDLVRRTGEARE